MKVTDISIPQGRISQIIVFMFLGIYSTNVQHLLIHPLHGQVTPEHCGHGQIEVVVGVSGSHHVPGIKHRLCELGHCQGPVLLAASAGQWGKAGHEEVQAGEGDHTDKQIARVSIELARKTQAGSDSTHGG